jgi:hypothetical protein
MTYYSDGYKDALAGVRYTPPRHLRRTTENGMIETSGITETEYSAGYKAGLRDIDPNRTPLQVTDDFINRIQGK